MKRNFIARTAAALALTIVFALSPNIAAMASANPETPTIARTKAWDGIEYSLGGIPEMRYCVQASEIR